MTLLPQGAAWAAVGSYAGAGSGYTNFAATSYSLYSTFGHGGNFFANFRDFGENYLVAAGTEATLAGAHAAVNHDSFTQGFSDNVDEQISTLQADMTQVGQQARSLMVDGRFLPATAVFSGPLKVLDYQAAPDDAPSTSYYFDAQLSAAWEKVGEIDQQTAGHSQGVSSHLSP